MSNEHPENKYREFDVEDPDAGSSLAEGVMDDKYSLSIISMWSVLGIITVILLIIIAYQLYMYNWFQTSERVSGQAEYRELRLKQERDHQRLTTFGVVDEEAGIYRVPIDSVMSYMAREAEEN